MKPLIIALALVTFAPAPLVAADSNQGDCPDGYYQMGATPDGSPACHLQPSGCPFYEDVSVKGCVPPAGVQCSDATFTNCWHVDVQPAAPAAPSAPQSTAPAPTVQTPVSTPKAAQWAQNAPISANSSASQPVADDADMDYSIDYSKHTTGSQQAAPASTKSVAAVIKAHDDQKVEHAADNVKHASDTFTSVIAALSGVGSVVSGAAWVIIKKLA